MKYSVTKTITGVSPSKVLNISLTGDVNAFSNGPNPDDFIEVPVDWITVLQINARLVSTANGDDLAGIDFYEVGMNPATSQQYITGPLTVGYYLSPSLYDSRDLLNTYTGRIFSSNYGWSQLGGTVNNIQYINWEEAVSTTVWEGFAIPTQQHLSEASFNNLNLLNNSVFAANRYIRVEGNLVNTGADSCLLVHDTASLITMGSVTGSGIFSSNITSNVWHLIASPVTDLQSSAFLGEFVQTYNEPTDTWNQIITADTIIWPGLGYSVWSSPKNYSGVFNTGDLSLPFGVTYSGNLHGYNLVGNPYPSGLDVSAVSTWGSEISSDVYVWDQAFGNYRTTVTTIPPAQGFFIRTTGNGPTLTIPNSARVHTSDPLYKSEVLNQLTLSLSGNGYGDEAFIRFAEGSSATFDHSFDTPKKMGLAEAPQLFSVVASDNFTDLTRNVLPRIEGNETVHLSFLAGNSGSFILEASGIESFSDDVVITLVDQLTNTTQVLSQNPVYSFNGSPVDDPARFLVLFDDYTASQSVSATYNIVVFTVGHTVKLLVPEDYTGTVTMTDMLGRVVWRQPLAGQSHYSFIAPVPAGCYVVSTESRHGSLRKKIILH
ncbi:MAG: hypothetical protein PHQ65_05830 [Bacteroidales bacterium]|nr:hypothetical protein [Bacteroidales bacterium]MDD3664763.1 hypothetical protein [Bacteroidales bacterium]